MLVSVLLYFSINSFIVLLKNKPKLLFFSFLICIPAILKFDKFKIRAIELSLFIALIYLKLQSFSSYFSITLYDTEIFLSLF